MSRNMMQKCLVLICVLFGMSLAANVASHGYDNAVNSITTPHLEGF